MEASLPDQSDTKEAAVVVPETSCTLNETASITFNEFSSQLPQTDNLDTEHYLNCLRLLSTLLSDEQPE